MRFLLFFLLCVVGTYVGYRRLKALGAKDQYKGRWFKQPAWMNKAPDASAMRSPAGAAGRATVGGADASMLLVLPESGEQAAILTRVLGIPAYDARTALASPGLARPLRAYGSQQDASQVASQLTAAGLKARALPKAEVSGLLAGAKRVARWSHEPGLQLETTDGERIVPEATPLLEVYRIYQTLAPAGAKKEPARSGRIENVALATGYLGGGLVGGMVARNALDAELGPSGSNPRAETVYFLGLRFQGGTLCFAHNGITSKDAGLASAFVSLEAQLAAMLPRERWVELRSVPGAHLIGGAGPEANLVLTEALSG